MSQKNTLGNDNIIIDSNNVNIIQNEEPVNVRAQRLSTLRLEVDQLRISAMFRKYVLFILLFLVGYSVFLFFSISNTTGIYQLKPTNTQSNEINSSLKLSIEKD